MEEESNYLLEIADKKYTKAEIEKIGADVIRKNTIILTAAFLLFFGAAIVLIILCIVYSFTDWKSSMRCGGSAVSCLVIGTIVLFAVNKKKDPFVEGKRALETKQSVCNETFTKKNNITPTYNTQYSTQPSNNHHSSLRATISADPSIINGNNLEIIPAEGFLKKYFIVREDYTGIYILHNVTNDKYYVGQAKKIISRVKQHLSGRGNGDVYADFKYTSMFEVCLVRLRDSTFGNLDDMERYFIRKFNAYINGYNKNSGNK